MSSSDVRLLGTFRLLMKVRILLAGMALLLEPRTDQGVAPLLTVLLLALLSVLGLLAARRFVDWIMRDPILLSLDVVASAVAMEKNGVLGPFFLFTVVTSVVAGLLHRRAGMLLVCTLQILLYSTAAAAQHLETNAQVALVMPVFYPIAGFVGYELRRLSDQYGAMDAARRRLEVQAAAADERTRLAREMHDSLAKTLQGIAMSATALPSWIQRSPERAVLESRRIVTAMNVASREARDLLADLRIGAVPGGLDQAVRAAVESTGLPVRLDLAPDLEVSGTARYEVVAILKESLENVRRHAADAPVEVSLDVADDAAVLTVRDHGAGFALESEQDLDALAAAGHYGLVGMRERAGRAGGALTIDSRPGEGTTVRVTVPLAARTPQLAEA